MVQLAIASEYIKEILTLNEMLLTIARAKNWNLRSSLVWEVYQITIGVLLDLQTIKEDT